MNLEFKAKIWNSYEKNIMRKGEHLHFIRMDLFQFYVHLQHIDITEQASKSIFFLLFTCISWFDSHNLMLLSSLCGSVKCISFRFFFFIKKKKKSESALVFWHTMLLGLFLSLSSMYESLKPLWLIQCDSSKMLHISLLQ